MIKTTRAQREALFRVFQRDFPGWITPTTRYERPCCPKCGYGGTTVKVPSKQWRKFRANVTRPLLHDGCIMLLWAGMWLGIETDGHTHS